jgi:cytochrome c
MTRAVIASSVATLAFIGSVAAQAPQSPSRFGFGQAATPDQIAAIDVDVRPDGTGLPPGKGTAREGAPIYASRCAACHGAKGEGGQADALVGAEPKSSLPFGPEYEKWRASRNDVPFTIGNYWPFATTLFDYIRRAMPTTAPGTLTADETYSVTAWLLAQNQVIAEDAEMNAQTLPRVSMPARSRFVRDDRKGGAQVR